MSMIPRPLFYLSFAGTTVGTVVLLKDYFGGARYGGKESMIGKTVIITGANSGIGKETAKDLANRGARVIMACRNMSKCEEARREILEESHNKAVVCKECDLASLASVRAFADKINKEESHLEVLINNAAVMAMPKSMTNEGFEMHLGVNHLGHFLLTNLLLDKLKKTPQGGRIITVTSAVYNKIKMDFHDLNYMEDYEKKSAYAQSKLANVLFTTELARRLEGTSVTANCVNPGVTKTNIGRHMSTEKSISYKVWSPWVWLLLKTPTQGAQGVIAAAVGADREGVSGKYYKRTREEDLTGTGLDPEGAQRLWLISEKWTRLVD